jgi:nifR3 family TIM-barrel protein
MAGCTDLAFRLIAREHGLELAFTEMISSEALVREHKKTSGLLLRTPQDHPTACQLVGHSPASMGKAAAIIEELGFEVVDINCGCPVRKITGQEAGAALLKDPGKAEEIFRSVKSHVKAVPVSAKMRIGYNDASGKEAVHLAKLAADSGFSFITVHGRTRAQGYAGRADWKAIAKVKKAVPIPVFGNGDIFAPQDALKMLEETGCDGVAIGRGALGNPWLYSQIKELLAGKKVHTPSLEDRKNVAVQHILLEAKFDGPKTGLLKSRHVGPWYFKGCPGASQLREQIHRSRSCEEVIEQIKAFGE